MDRLTQIGRMADRHWQEHRPRMYQALKAAGNLEPALLQAQEQTKETLAQLIGQGVPYQEAWEQVREMWILLPDEETSPTLPSQTGNWLKLLQKKHNPQ